jgi:hypothetical protein
VFKQPPFHIEQKTAALPRKTTETVVRGNHAMAGHD